MKPIQKYLEKARKQPIEKRVQIMWVMVGVAAAHSTAWRKRSTADTATAVGATAELPLLAVVAVEIVAGGAGVTRAEESLSLQVTRSLLTARARLPVNP